MPVWSAAAAVDTPDARARASKGSFSGPTFGDIWRHLGDVRPRGGQGKGFRVRTATAGRGAVGARPAAGPPALHASNLHAVKTQPRVSEMYRLVPSRDGYRSNRGNARSVGGKYGSAP